MATARGLLAAVCALACVYIAAAAPGKYVKANIVDSWAECPVKSPTEWDPKVFNSSLEALTALSEDKYAAQISKSCQETLLSLADCASDNDPFSGSATTSLSTSDGCCLKSCANAIKGAISGGCFDQLLKTSLCVDPSAQKYKTGLFNAGIRCANYRSTCPDATADAAAAPAGAADAAAPAGSAAGAAAAAETEAEDSSLALEAAPAKPPAAAKSGAGAAAASAAMAVAGAVALLAAL